MQYITQFISIISVIVFSALVITILRSNIDNIRKGSFVHFFLILLIWQLSNLGVFFSSKPVTAIIFYRIALAASAGFLFSYLPLCLGVMNHRKTFHTIVITFILFGIYVIISILKDFIVNLYIGKGGFLVQNLRPDMKIYFSPALLVFLSGVAVCVINIFRQKSVIIRQRLLYFLIVSILILLGIISNLTSLKEMPFDVFLILLSGILLAYLFLNKRLLDIRKAFPRGILNAALVAGSGILFTLGIFITSAILEKTVPYETVLPALVIFLLIFILFNQRLNQAGKSFLYNSVFFINSAFEHDLESYSMSVRKAYEFSEIFDAFHSAIIDEFPVCWMTVYMLDTVTGNFRLNYYDENLNKSEASETITEVEALQSCLKKTEICMVDELSEAEYKELAGFFNYFPGENPPDVILPLKINHEVVGMIVFRFRKEKNFFLDNEGWNYLLKLGKYTEDAIVRAYAFEQLARDVYSKDNLIKDINHRVKNNLQMITALLAMQELSTRNKEAGDILNVARRRVEIIANIHEMLYIGGVVKTINLRDYVLKVISGFDGRSIEGTEIDFQVEVPDFKLETEKALTFCLIINELVGNAVKYAFPGREYGRISLNIERERNVLRCIIHDNGAGYTESADSLSERGGIGHKLVSSFVTTQLKGSWEMINDNGTRHIILIPL